MCKELVVSSAPGVRSRAGPCFGCGLCVVAQAPVKEFPPISSCSQEDFCFLHVQGLWFSWDKPGRDFPCFYLICCLSYPLCLLKALIIFNREGLIYFFQYKMQTVTSVCCLFRGFPNSEVG